MVDKIDIGIIGSYGLVRDLQLVDSIKPKTEYGKPSSEVKIYKVSDLKVGVLARHGENHTIPPHKIKYRANIQALKNLGARKLITISAVGSLDEDYHPGDLVVTDQFIDSTKSRERTFYDGSEVRHVAMEPPFCKGMRDLAMKVLDRRGIIYHKTGTYNCIEGPQFSTKAESKKFSRDSNIIGMTLCPEVQLAREAEMCCLNISMVTDYDVWKEEHEVSAEMIIETVTKNDEKVKIFLEDYLKKIEIEDCKCNHSLDGTKLSKN